MLILVLLLMFNSFIYSTQFIQSPTSPSFVKRKWCSIICLSNRNNESRSSGSIPLLILQNQVVILPGEEKTIWTDEITLIKDSIKDHHSLIALGIFLSEDHGGEGEDEDLMEMASLCKIKNYNSCAKNVYGHFVTIVCVGRIKLKSLDQYKPYFKFHFTLVQELEEHLKECKLVVKNIETFINKFSQDEDINRIVDDDEGHSLLSSKYKASLAKNLHLLKSSNTYQSDLMRSLVASSWAAFTATENSSFLNIHIMKKYRIRALDYDNVFDRLKLAQYMLREQELHIIGLKLQQGKNDDGGGSTMDGIRQNLRGFE